MPAAAYLVRARIAFIITSQTWSALESLASPGAGMVNDRSYGFLLFKVAISSTIEETSIRSVPFVTAAHEDVLHFFGLRVYLILDVVHIC